MTTLANLAPNDPRSTSLAPDIRVNRVTEAQWAQYLAEFSDANFYQSWAFGAVSWGNRQLSHLVLTESDSPVGLAQVRIVRVPILGAGVAYVRWGPCIQRRGSAWHIGNYRRCIDALVNEYGRRNRLVIRIIPNIFQEDPYSAEAQSVLSEYGFEREASIPPYRTLRVDLTPDPLEIRKRFDGKWRNILNGAERNELQISEGTDDEHYAQFLTLYGEMMARKQFDTTVDPNEFRVIQRRLAPREKMIISVCRKDNLLLSALVCTPIGETGIYLLGATNSEGMKHKSSNLLQWTMMNRLRERGVRSYDLGGINPEANPGVYKFKQGMGGVESHQLGRYLRPGGAVHNMALSAAEWLQRSLKRHRQNRQPNPQPPHASKGDSEPSLPTA